MLTQNSFIGFRSEVDQFPSHQTIFYTPAACTHPPPVLVQVPTVKGDRRSCNSGAHDQDQWYPIDSYNKSINHVQQNSMFISDEHFAFQSGLKFKK